MTPRITLRKALSDPSLLGASLAGDTWHAWRTLLLAIVGEALTPEELITFQMLTGRDASPASIVEEFVGVIGRRGGKSRAMGVLAAYLAALVDHSAKLVPGERGVVLLIAPDQKQSRVLLQYVEGALRSSPVLEKLIEGQTQETLTLSNGIDIEVRAASFRRLRGVTSVAIIADEAAFWFSDEASANVDTEILAAARPSLATTGGPLIIISSPYARRGEVWEMYRKYFQADGDPMILVAQAASRTMNPSLPAKVVERALERDPAAAAAEFLAQFRSDIEAFVSREVVDACTTPGVFERRALPGRGYKAFVDPSGGSVDSMTLAIAHHDGELAVLDMVREWRAPFSPEQVTKELVADLKLWGVNRVIGDGYSAQWAQEAFRRQGVQYEPSDKNKSQIYTAALPLLNSRRALLIDNQRLAAQLIGLERKTARGGRDTIDHAPRSHDDLANAACGALVAAIHNQVQPVRFAPTFHMAR